MEGVTDYGLFQAIIVTLGSAVVPALVGGGTPMQFDVPAPAYPARQMPYWPFS